MSYKLTGVVKKVGDKIQVSEKFAKRELVVTDTTGMYPQDISVEFANAKADDLSGIMEGQEVEVSFNLRGRLWVSPQGEEKYFNTIDGWRVDVLTTGTSSQSSIPQASTAGRTAAAAANDAADDSLPF